MTISQADFDEAADLWNMMLANGLQHLDAFQFCAARLNQYLDELELELPVIDSQSFHVKVARA